LIFKNRQKTDKKTDKKPTKTDKTRFFSMTAQKNRQTRHRLWCVGAHPSLEHHQFIRCIFLKLIFLPEKATKKLQKLHPKNSLKSDKKATKKEGARKKLHL
jgi:hypothetical protein